MEDWKMEDWGRRTLFNLPAFLHFSALPGQIKPHPTYLGHEPVWVFGAGMIISEEILRSTGRSREKIVSLGRIRGREPKRAGRGESTKSSPQLSLSLPADTRDLAKTQQHQSIVPKATITLIGA